MARYVQAAQALLAGRSAAELTQGVVEFPPPEPARPDGSR